ncbi:aldehyde ferredoxin oxidoreductase family protein [Desulfotruncus alcoholivorax]|uniref:aldehyde ferredoxin oxidoreductase family protein n=1 Tax=Desulfotruncus alcoholivorax TaxID=265477 RepID=UPI0004227DB6|nr:aldehyde ferredoxin oxidoreductase C-terminal domain-containing protein [Desulfotruncus alcoholivorax]
MNVEKIKAAHKLLAEFKYTPGKLDKGYANKSLYINVSENKIEAKPVTEMMKEKFTGGRGFGLWYLWNAVTPETKWNDPENEIIISPGPVGGITQYPGAGKSLVVSLSPLTGSVMDSNVGGHFGPLLKFSGWDALELQGKAEKDVVIFIDGNAGIIRIEEAPEEALDSHLLVEQLYEIYADTPEDKRNISVVSTGAAAEHILYGMLNFSLYDTRRKAVRLKQAGRGGIGTVLRDKKVKAIVVKFKGVKGNLNNPADFAALAKTGIKMHKEIHAGDDKQCQMRVRGTTYLVKIMNDYDLLPVCNFKYGSHPDGNKIAAPKWIENFNIGKADGCWYGCTLSCSKVICDYELKTGPYKGQKVVTDAPEYETIAGVGSNCGIFDPQFIIEANFYCDTYGVDTISFGTTTAFLMECYENGIINRQITGGLDLRFGNQDAAMELLHQMARGEGFGRIAGLGVRKCKELFVREYGAGAAFLNDIGMEVKGLEYAEYVSKESLVQQGGFGMANKGPQHDEAWLIFMDMVNNQLPTFENKAEALHYFPMFRTWLGLVGLCKLPWNDIVPENNAQTDEPAKIPEHVQNYVDIFNAVTGKNIDKKEMILQSERVYNFQKVFNIKMGFGTREHDKIPYRSVGPVTVEEYESRQDRYDSQLKELLGMETEGKSTEEKLKALREYREAQYEKLVDAVYERRGWTPNGIPKLETLQKLGIDLPEVVEVVQKSL